MFALIGVLFLFLFKAAIIVFTGVFLLVIVFALGIYILQALIIGR